MTHDREYYRCLPDSELIRRARDSGHELCIALGERLEDLADIESTYELCIALGERLEDLADIESTYEEVCETLAEAQRKIATLEADLEALERDFEALQDARG